MTPPSSKDHLALKYDEEVYGSKYNQADLEVPLDPAPFDAAGADKTIAALKAHPVIPDLPLYGHNMHGQPVPSSHPHHDHGDPLGGGAPYDTKNVQDRLGKGQASWVDLYRAMKNDPNHPACMVAKYLVHFHNHAAEYAQGGDKARQLDQAYRDLHFDTKNKYAGHMVMADVVALAQKNSGALKGMLAMQASLHQALRKGLGPKLREINGETYIALARGLNSPVMSHEQSLRSFAHKPNTGFGSNMFYTWVPLKDLWYSFDLGPKFPNGNMGPEDEHLVSNSGPRYEAAESDVVPLRYKSTGKDEGQYNATILPVALYYDDAKDADLARFVQKRLVDYRERDQHLEDYNAAKFDAARRYETAVAPFHEEYDRAYAALREAKLQKVKQLDAEGDQAAEAYKRKEIDHATYSKAVKKHNVGYSAALLEFDDNLMKIVQKRNAATAPHEAAHRDTMMALEQKYGSYIDLDPAAELEEILEHPAVGPVTGAMLREYANDAKLLPGFSTINANLAGWRSKLLSEKELEAMVYKRPEVVQNPRFGADAITRYLMNDIKDHQQLKVFKAPNLNSNHIQLILDNPRNGAHAMMAVAGSKVATKEQKDRAVDKLQTLDPLQLWGLYRSDGYNDGLPPRLADLIAAGTPDGEMNRSVLRCVSGDYVRKLADLAETKDEKAVNSAKMAMSYSNHVTDDELADILDKNPDLVAGMVWRADHAPISLRLQDKVFSILSQGVMSGNKGTTYLAQDLVRLLRDNRREVSGVGLQSFVLSGLSFISNNPKHKHAYDTYDALKSVLRRLGNSANVPDHTIEALWPYPDKEIKYRVDKDSDGDPFIVPDMKGIVDPNDHTYKKDLLQHIATEVAQRREYAKNRKAHIILPFPANLAKSEDAFWDAKVAEWLSSIKHVKGYWYGTSMEAIHDIVDRGSILPHPTKKLLEGQAVFAVKAGSLEFKTALKEWAERRGEEPAILYFETDLAPEVDPDHPKQVYWTQEVPIKNDRVEHDDAPLTKSQELDLLVKYQTTFTFPKLGVGDDRRDTQTVTTPQQTNLATQVLANKAAQVVSVDSGRKVKSWRMLPEARSIPNKAFGVAVGGVQGVAPVSFRFSGSEAASLHEDTHKIFNRVAEKYGPKARERLANHLWDALPASSRRVLSTWLEGAVPQYKGRDQNAMYREEAFATLLNYLNDPKQRQRLKTPPQFMRFLDTGLKRAHRHLQAVAETVSPEWLKSDTAPWVQPKGTAAYQAGLAKAETFEDRLKAMSYSTKRIEDWEHDTAAMMAGEDLDSLKGLAAAKFLSGKEPDQEKYAVALRLLDDPDRAALYSVGLPDNARNLKALVAAKGFTEMSKAEPGVPHILSVEPANEEGRETATQIQRGIQHDLIKPLKLKGKHSSGTQVVKDPETERTWLLKPGSGKLSPGKGISDEKASMSAREAAFWHGAKVMGLEEYVPRTDLILVNAQEWAAVALVPFNYKTIDKLNRQESGKAAAVLEPYRKKGLVHRWAVMDGVLSNVDSHGQNVLTDGVDVKLIDHGSTFAGVNFDPAHDTKSFIPFYLRAWAGPDFAQLSPEERFKAMPGLDHEAAQEFSVWLESIDENRLMAEVAKYGIDPSPVIARLRNLKATPTYHGVLECWAGLREWQ